MASSDMRPAASSRLRQNPCREEGKEGGQVTTHASFVKRHPALMYRLVLSEAEAAYPLSGFASTVLFPVLPRAIALVPRASRSADKVYHATHALQKSGTDVDDANTRLRAARGLKATGEGRMWMCVKSLPVLAPTPKSHMRMRIPGTNCAKQEASCVEIRSVFSLSAEIKDTRSHRAVVLSQSPQLWLRHCSSLCGTELAYAATPTMHCAVLSSRMLLPGLRGTVATRALAKVYLRAYAPAMRSPVLTLCTVLSAYVIATQSPGLTLCNVL
eukprot:3283324-Rhodomonas_salina.2